MENKAVFYLTDIKFFYSINDFMMSLEAQGYKCHIEEEECVEGYEHYITYVVRW